MATRYWVGGTGTWDSSATTHWSASTGGASGASAPVAGDTAIFDSGSGTSATVTVDVTATCKLCTVNKSDITLTGTLNMAGPAAIFTGTAALSLSGLSLALTGFGTLIPGMNTVTGTGTVVLANITATGSGGKYELLAISQNVTLSGTLTVGGGTTQGNQRMLVWSGTVGVTHTVTCAAVVITGDVDWLDVAVAGSPTWTNTGAAFIGDCGGTSGQTFTIAAPQSWQTTTSGNWSDATKWTSRSPLPQDTVTISKAFSASQTISGDMPRLGNTIDCTGTTGSPTISISNDVDYHGGLNLASAVKLFGSGQHQFIAHSGSYSINIAGTSFTSSVIIGSQGTMNATYTLAGDLSITGSASALKLLSGTFDASTHNVSLPKFSSNVDNPRTLKMGSGTWSFPFNGNLTVWDAATAVYLTFDPGTAIIDITASDSGVTKTFNGGGHSFPTLRFRSTGTAMLAITGSNTFAAWDFECTTARQIVLPASGSQSVSGAITLAGAAGQLLAFVSSSPGTTTTIVPGNPALVTTAYCSFSSDIVFRAWEQPTVKVYRKWA